MEYQLTVGAIVRHTIAVHAHRPIVTRRANRRLHRSTYGEMFQRARSLAIALRDLGIRPGDRVATLCSNHHQHLEASFGIPASGAVLLTLNPRLHADELGYIVSHAGARALIVDRAFWPSASLWCAHSRLETIIVIGDENERVEGTLGFEALLAAAEGDREYEYPEIDENAPAAMSYTKSGAGRARGVHYSHRAIALHAMSLAMTTGYALAENDIVAPIAPMHQANAWGFPYACALVGAAQVLPGPHVDAKSVLELLLQERVTLAAAPAAVWLDVLRVLDASAPATGLDALRAVVVGSRAAPEPLMRALGERHGLQMVHAWGMTEAAPIGQAAAVAGQTATDDQPAGHRSRVRPAPFMEIRARDEAGALVPWDGVTSGELEIRAPWTVRSYFAALDGTDRFAGDGWFRTGDIVTIDSRGHFTVRSSPADPDALAGDVEAPLARRAAERLQRLTPPFGVPLDRVVRDTPA